MAATINRTKAEVRYALDYYVTKTWRESRYIPPKKKRAKKKQPKPPRPRRTCFAVGHVPANTVDIGTVTVRNNNGVPAKFIKLAYRGWVPYPRYLWEQEHGPIPPGHIIVFVDGNPMNCELSNLQAISRAEHAKRNYNPSKVSERMKAHWAKVKRLESLGIESHSVKLKSKRKPTQANVPARVDAEQLRIAKDFFNNL